MVPLAGRGKPGFVLFGIALQNPDFVPDTHLLWASFMLLGIFHSLVPRLTLARKPTLLEPWQTEMSTYIPKVGLESIQFRSQQAQINQPATSNISFFHRRSSCFTFGGWEVWTQANISDSCPSLRFELGDAAMTEGAHICNIHIDRCIIYTKYIYILQWLRMKYIDQAVWFSPHFGREKHGLTLLWKNNRASQRNNLAIIFFLTCKAGDTIRKITFLTILKSYAE